MLLYGFLLVSVAILTRRRPRALMIVVVREQQGRGRVRQRTSRPFGQWPPATLLAGPGSLKQRAAVRNQLRRRYLKFLPVGQASAFIQAPHNVQIEIVEDHAVKQKALLLLAYGDVTRLDGPGECRRAAE